MASKIPPELVEPILEKAAASVGFREIASWLGKRHGVTVSHMAVARLVQREGAVRASAAKSVARQKLAHHVTSDLDRLELFAKKAMRIARGCEGNPEVWVKVARELRGILVEKLKLSGAGADEDSDNPVRVFLPPEE